MIKKIILVFILSLFLISCDSNKNNEKEYVMLDKTNQNIEINNNDYDVLLWESDVIKGIDLNDFVYFNNDICTIVPKEYDICQKGEYVFLRLLLVNDELKEDFKKINNLLKEYLSKDNILEQTRLSKVSNEISLNLKIIKEENDYYLLIQSLIYSSKYFPNIVELKEKIELNTNYLRLNTIMSIIYPSGQVIDYNSFNDFINSIHFDGVFEFNRKITLKYNNVINVGQQTKHIISSKIKTPIIINNDVYNFKNVFADNEIDCGTLYYINNDGNFKEITKN